MEYLLRKFCVLLNIHIYRWDAVTDKITCFGMDSADINPLCASAELRLLLKKRADGQEIPAIYEDGQRILFACIREAEGSYLLLGPVCTEELTYVEIHQFYKSYGVSKEKELHPPKLRIQRFFAALEMLCYEICGEMLAEGELMDKNGLTMEPEINLKREETTIQEEGYHHTYQEEVKAMNYIREGRLDEIIKASEALAETAGKLSENEINAERNLGIASVTLATRAAIEGGVSPAAAYKLSDIYINKIDQCKSLPQLYKYRRQNMYDFAKLVADEKKRKMYSSYIEQCKDFIHKNYRHKIYVDDIAEALGISESHLSRTFKKETGITIQEYMLRFRVECAENLLKYSEASLSEISDYLCFHSQSHFGRVFRQYEEMTPREYREKFKQKEFVSH